MKLAKKFKPLSRVQKVLWSLILFAAMGGLGWYLLLKPPVYGVCLQGFNYTDRHIHKFSVNGFWGGGISKKEAGDEFGGGGKFACGPGIGGKEVLVRWTYELKSYEELKAGVVPESHEVVVPMPEAESRSSRYFQVHIYPDHHVVLKLKDHID